MPNQTEIVMPREAMPETKELFDIMEKIPPEMLYGVTQFIRGVSYGLDMVNRREAERESA